jgi:preprotein translocase subunit SecB
MGFEEGKMASEHLNDENNIEQNKAPSSQGRGLFPLPFDIQLQSTCVSEIIARKFPLLVSESSGPFNPNISLGLTNIQIDEKNLLAQVILSVQIGFPTEPKLFDISFGILGLFTYTSTYPIDQVRLYLEQGSFSILLPFARELLASLCTRLQVPVFYIPMFPIVSSSSEEAEAHK